ncbi:DUF4232 domain-containing protein [Actinophytocola oryzae]|uniref:Uncharacterized protein DUF4232 n=1 Tax=Actinophytocola oryzae TaxID=502181 RepID=A0A4R7VNW8_9PSEU|nr:DUF4232 domain-containing protein [Actinophytocola oryzae]TDV50969.1 uncharacterized protein DUF4232 [Actinophytocola oryzae]
MLRNKFRTGVLITGGVTAALLLAACNSGDTASSSSDVPTITQSSSSAKPVLPPTSSPSGTVEAGQPAAPAPATPASNECKVADLDLRLGGGDAAAGTSYRALVFTNKGGRTCTVQGFPGVSYVAGDDGHQVGPAAYRSGEKGKVITLKPGDSAFVNVGFVQVGNYDASVCKPTEVRGLRIYPPHDYDSAFVANPGTGCAGTPPGNQLTVSTMQAGAGPA